MTTPSGFIAASKSASSRLRSSAIEALESRIAPATVTTAGLYSYTDGDGDSVLVQVTGKFTSVQFLDGSSADVLDNGGDISSIVVTGAKSDFQLSFKHTGTTILSDGIIELGSVVGKTTPTATVTGKVPLIKGIATYPLASAANSEFTLAGYSGLGFAAYGGISLKGDLSTGTGIVVDNLAANTFIDVTGSVPNGASIIVSKALAGTLDVDGTIDGLINAGSVAKTGLINLNTVNRDVTVLGAFAGRITVADTATDLLGEPIASIKINGATTAGAAIIGTGEILNVSLVGKVSGGLISIAGDPMAETGDLNLTASAAVAGLSVNVGHDLFINAASTVATTSFVVRNQVIQGSTIAGIVTNASFQVGDDLYLTVGGFTGTRLNTVDTGYLAINGPVTTSELTAGYDLNIESFGGISGSRILADNDLTLSVQDSLRSKGNILNSVISAREGDLLIGNADALIIGVAGTITGSGFSAGETSQIVVQKGWTGSNIATSGALDIIVVEGLMTRGLILSGQEMDLTAVGFNGSIIQPANDATVSIGAKGMVGGRIDVSEQSITVNTEGPLSATSILGATSVTVNTVSSIASNVLLLGSQDVSVTSTAQLPLAPAISAGKDVFINTLGAFNGAVNAGHDLTIVAGSLASSAGRAAVKPGVLPGLIVGNNLELTVNGNVSAPLIDVGNDVTELAISGTFKGRFIIGGDLLSGIQGASDTLIGGSVLAGSSIIVRGDLGGDDTAAAYTFGGAMAGSLSVYGDVVADLTFVGAVNRLALLGAIGNDDSQLDGIAQIVVTGNLTALDSLTSLYRSTGATAGDFYTGGTQSGSLSVSGTIKTQPKADFFQI